jgi:hypothetical protein
MSTTDYDPIPEPEAASLRATLFRQAPYIVVLILAIAGVAYSNLTRQSLVGYWEFLAVAVGGVCVFTQWGSADERSGRFRLIGTQILHWGAVLVMMNIMVAFQVQSMIPTPAISLVLLALLALGTFLAGVDFLSIKICFLGVAMALTVPAIAWLTQSFLFLLLVAVLIGGVAIALWPSRKGRRRQEPDDV